MQLSSELTLTFESPASFLIPQSKSKGQTTGGRLQPALTTEDELMSIGLPLSHLGT
ncbi:hypothetical protein EMIT0P294_60230 [Pseudomonas sp. IT-P294]